MKQMKRSLESLSKNLKTLTKKTEQMIASLGKMEKAQAKKAKPAKAAAKKTVAKKTVAKKAPAKKKPAKKAAVKKAKTPSATENVLKIINRSKKGVDTAQLHKKTGYNTRKIWDIVHRAYKEGKIEKVGRGAYIKKT